jgi:hypothetical protein
MPTRSSKRKETDPNVRAFLTVQRATGQLAPEEPVPDTRNPHAVALGKLGGAKGGKARAVKLSARKRSDIAKRAARARWGNRVQGSSRS